MATKRITALTEDTSPATTEFVMTDGTATKKVTIANLVGAARPFASQSEAETGSGTTQTMNPLTTKQAHDYRLTQAETITGVKTFTPSSLTGQSAVVRYSDNGASAGPMTDNIRHSDSPAASDQLGAFRVRGFDSAGNELSYAQYRARILDPTDGTEDGEAQILVPVASTQTVVLSLGPGLYLGAATGGSQGVGTVNATDFYKNGNLVSWVPPVANRTAMLALSTSTTPECILTEAGRSGTFVWDGSDLSSTLMGSNIASSSVDSSTETITSADHGLLPGMAVVPTAAVNGLSANTVYYAIVGTIWTIHFNTQTANFTVGQTLTGGTSGATGVIVKQDDDGTDGVLWLSGVTGTFQQAETITDGAGGSAKADGTTQVVFDPDRFKLATSYANAIAGTAVNLTGTSAMTVRRHYDAAQGVYVTPSSDVTGASGAWCRSDRFVRAPVASWFGVLASNSGATNSAALQAAFNYTGTVYVPRGQYELTLKQYVLGRMSLIGDGPAASVLYWKDATSHGIEQYFTNDRSEMANVDSVGFLTNDTAGTSVALKFDGTARLVGTASNGTSQMVMCQNVNITGLTGPSTAGWDGGIWCYETVNANLDNCYFNGYFVTSEADIRSAFAFRSSSTDNGAGSVFKLDNCQAYYAFRAVYFDTVEGVQVHHCVLVAVEYGVFGRVTGTKVGPHVSVQDTHINARLRCIDLDEAQQVYIDNNLLYQRPQASATGYGVVLSGVRDGHVANNIIIRNGDTGENFSGVLLSTDTINVQVHDNIFRDTTYGVWAQSGSSGNRAYSNDLRVVGNAAAELYLDGSSGANTFGAHTYSGTNASTVNATVNVATALCTVSPTLVYEKQRFDVFAQVRLTKGATAGMTHLIVAKSAGTATVNFNHSVTEMRNSPYVANGTAPSFAFAGTMEVTAVGASNTLTVQLSINSTGSGADVDAGEADLILVERN